MNATIKTTGNKMLLILMVSALGSILLSVLAGMLGVLYYVPAIGSWMSHIHLSFVQLRPLHTTFASVWVFLGAVACVYKFLFDVHGEPNARDQMLFKVQMVLWGIAGLGILLTLSFGITSGREYVGFIPVFSLFILAGWLLFAITFFRKVRFGFWKQPVYVYMWSVGILLFIYTFVESQAYLLPFIKKHPIQDMQIQWKSYGTLVASFNQLVYGSLFYLTERFTGDRKIAQSNTAFALFSVGLLNSFTNYAHHTYHLPQNHLIKWVSFIVTMLEVIILARVFQDITALIKKRQPKLKSSSHYLCYRFINLSKFWNLFLLTFAILISIPILNTFVHGSMAIMGHAMISEIAIDTFILFALFSAILMEISPVQAVLQNLFNGNKMRWTVSWLNISLIGLVLWLVVSGSITGVANFYDIDLPGWLRFFPYGFLFFGFMVAFPLIRLGVYFLLECLRHLFPRSTRRMVTADNPLPDPN